MKMLNLTYFKKPVCYDKQSDWYCSTLLWSDIYRRRNWVVYFRTIILIPVQKKTIVFKSNKWKLDNKLRRNFHCTNNLLWMFPIDCVRKTNKIQTIDFLFSRFFVFFYHVYSFKCSSIVFNKIEMKYSYCRLYIFL
jgi:hypothetical protein